MQTPSDNALSEPNLKYSGRYQESQYVDAGGGQYRAYSVILAFMPVLSFAMQWAFSVRADTQIFLRQHLTVMVVDWVFVPFNYVVVGAIDWKRGLRLYLIFCLSAALTVATHAFWQYNGVDFGHMITKSGIVLPAGWVHVTFSICEMVLLVAFVFCRRPGARTTAPTVLAVLYFVAMGICGYLMHHGFVITDIVVFVTGLFFILAYPRFSTARH